MGIGRDFDESKRKRTKNPEISENMSHDNSSLSKDNINYKRSAREKKKKSIDDIGYVEKDKLKGAKNTLLVEMFKKCDKGFQKIKRHPYADFFAASRTQDEPSLAQIERNMKDYKYQTIYQFGLDLRKLWSYYFANYTTDPDIFQKTCKLSEYSEEVIKELELIPDEKSDIQELSKKLEKLTNDIKIIQGRPAQQAPVKKNDKSSSNLDKPMNINEKNALGNSIRILNPEQLKGIVNILSDSMVIDAKSKFFEFDIETLSTRKLREIERYVKSFSAPN